ncbi:MAG: IclR family transcriptional regulator [Syntrophaceae bacterium]|nr:IclR family transcriptional regulator [Syntrophaceae bacterium]
MKDSKNFITSLSRGLSLLSVLAESPTPLNLTELSNRLQLSMSTIQRLVFTLKQLGYLERDEDTKKFRTGPKILSIGLSVIRNLNLRKVAFPYLEKTSKEVGETVNLAILDGTEIVYVERIKTQQILNINLEIGSRLPAFCTSMGKAILAYLPKDHLEALLSRTELVPRTFNTITQREAIRKELEKVRRRGFATNNEELAVGLRSVAAPVRNFRGEVIAAVNIAVPSIRVPQKKLETVFAPKVMETARRISSNLGYKEVNDDQTKKRVNPFETR